MKVKPTKHEDGSETVTLYGKTVDVTGKDSFTLFKREHEVVRRKKKEEKGDEDSSKTEASDEQ